MSYQAEVYRVFIASPSDVTEERKIIRKAIDDWNTVNSKSKKIVLLPVSWETHSKPQMEKRPQEAINENLLKDCDLLVGVFWTKIGTATGGYESGTVEEIEKHIATGKPTMLYFSDVNSRPSSTDSEQYGKVQEFQQRIMKEERGQIHSYKEIEVFKEEFIRHLQLTVAEFEPQDELPKISPTNDNSSLSEEARELIMEVAKTHDGKMIKTIYRDLTVLRIGWIDGKSFGGQTAKNSRIWEGALNELLDNNLVELIRTRIYRITRKGYDVAASLERGIASVF